MDMTTSVLTQIMLWKHEARWKHGNLQYPSNFTTPTLTNLCNDLGTGEVECLRMATPLLRRQSSTITCVADQTEYTMSGESAEVSDIWGWRIGQALLLDTLGDALWVVTYRPWESIVALDPTWQQENEVTGKPIFYTFNPATGKLGFYPTPDAAYSIVCNPGHVPPLLALGANYTWFKSDIYPAGEQTFNSWTRRDVDRPRRVIITIVGDDIPGALGSATHVITINGKAYPHGHALQETVDISGCTNGTIVGTSSQWMEIGETAMPNLSATDAYLHFGISDTDVTVYFPSTESSSLDTNTFHTAQIGANVSTYSLLPDHWARQCGVLYAAWMHHLRKRNWQTAGVLQRRWEEIKAAFAEWAANPSGDTLYAFDRDEGIYTPYAGNSWGTEL